MKRKCREEGDRVIIRGRIEFRLRSRLRGILWNIRNRLPEGEMTADTLHGRLTFSSKDRSIGRHLFIKGHYGYAIIRRAIGLLKKDHWLVENEPGYLLDVGANVGTVCIGLILDGVFARALAFEPEPRNYAYLRRNIAQNHLVDRISPYQYGVSSANTELSLDVSDRNWGGHRIRPAEDSPSERRHERSQAPIKVSVRTLDSVIEAESIEPEEIKLIWTDTQGHDGHVIKGARSIIAAGAPVVSELWPRGIERSGIKAEGFKALVMDSFTHLWDLRAETLVKMPVSSIGVLFQKYSGKSFTDILLINERCR